MHLEPVWEGAYYVDGHFCPYSGSRPVSKAWNATRRVVEPGQTDVYVHDGTGRVLFFINRPLNDHLTKAVPQILQEIRTVVPAPAPILLIFDRGGYSGPLFKALTRGGIGFITYLKGRAARRRFPSERFERRWWEITDPAGIQRPRRVVYRVFEKGTRIRGAGLLRTLVIDDEDTQIPVLTNCADVVFKDAELGRLLAESPRGGTLDTGPAEPRAAARDRDVRGARRAVGAAIDAYAHEGPSRHADGLLHARHDEHRPPQSGQRDQDRHLQRGALVGATVLPALPGSTGLVDDLSLGAATTGSRDRRPRGWRSCHAPATGSAPRAARVGGDARRHQSHGRSALRRRTPAHVRLGVLN